MPKFIFTELVSPQDRVETARLGAGTGAANWVDAKEIAKLVKLAGESRFNLCSVGDEFDGRIEAVEVATLDNFSYGSVRRDGRMEVTFDGLQATPGTGALAIGDFVVTGTPIAKGTALIVPARVCKATAAAEAVLQQWRVISLGSVGTGAVSTTGLIEKV